MSLNILLLEHPRIESEAHFNDVANAPLSACLVSGSVAALLRQNGHDARVYESYLAGESFSECLSRMRGLDFDLLGVHGVYFWEQTPALFSFLQEIRTDRPDVPLVLYGVFPTAAWPQILGRFSSVDAVITGEPEITFLDIADALSLTGRLEPRGIPGLAFSEQGQAGHTGSRPLINDLDGLPFPARSDLSLRALGGSVLGSRGCSGRCSFCCIPPYYGKGSNWRGRSPQNIAAEIEALMPSLERKYVYFLDADFFGRGREKDGRALETAGRIKDFSLEFGLECRSGDVGEATLPALVQAGLRDVFLGVESASSAALGRMKKGQPPGGSRQAIALLRRYDIEPSIGFIMFEPDSTLTDIRANFEFLRSNRLLGRLCHSANVLYHRMIALRGTSGHARLEAAARLEPADALAYEGRYRFADPEVQVLADAMSGLCRKVLKIASEPGSALYWGRKESPAARRTNDFLVSFFDETLRRLELGDLPRGLEGRLRLEGLQDLKGLVGDAQR